MRESKRKRKKREREKKRKRERKIKRKTRILWESSNGTVACESFSPILCLFIRDAFFFLSPFLFLSLCVFLSFLRKHGEFFLFLRRAFGFPPLNNLYPPFHLSSLSLSSTPSASLSLSLLFPFLFSLFMFSHSSLPLLISLLSTFVHEKCRCDFLCESESNAHPI